MLSGGGQARASSLLVWKTSAVAERSRGGGRLLSGAGDLRTRPVVKGDPGACGGEGAGWGVVLGMWPFPSILFL